MDNQSEEQKLNKIRLNNWIDFELSVQVIAEFIGVTFFVMAVIYFAYCQITNQLNEALEESVAKSSKTIAYELNKQFEFELMRLQSQARSIERGETVPKELIQIMEIIEGRHAGVLRPNGTALAGQVPPSEIFWVAEDAFQGKPLIRYIKNVGLMFATPVYMDGVNYVLYNYYEDDFVRNRFSTMSYNGDGTVVLLNSINDWAIIADGVEQTEIMHPDLSEGWQKLGQKMNYALTGNFEGINDAGAVFYEFHGKHYFLYGAVVSYEYNFAISGFVPWESVAVGVDAIYIVMLAVFGLVILLLIMGGRTLFKTRENQQLLHEKMLAVKANQTKSDFLSNMSHEIRTPINAILGMDEMILRESKDNNILEYAENLRHAGNNLLGIVNDILDFSKIEAGKMEIIKVEYSVCSLLNDLVNMIKPRANKKNLQLIVNADENLPSILFGDEIRIKQVITNILTNAVKYTEKGSVTLSVNFSKCDEENIFLKISIADTGIGIKKEDIPKLFSAFERIEEKRNRTIEGTGLGMNITQQLLRMMDSKLEVSSVYGEGSRFSFDVAQKVVNSEPLGNFVDAFKKSISQHEEYHEKLFAPDAKILVVDDTAMNLTVIKSLLKQTKIKIDTAENGYICLKLAAEKKYDIIFLDHRMPGIDGIETLKKMKTLVGNKNLKTPVISLTANAISGAREKYIEAGFSDYLTKPINSVALENLIVKYLPPELIKTPEDDPDEKVSKEKISESENLPDWLNSVEGLNITAGIEHCGGVESYIDVLKVFAEAVNSGSAEIERYFKNEDWKNYTTKVHALKSTAKVVGAEELSDKAKRLEDAGNSGYIDEIKTFTPFLLNLYKSYAEKLSPLIEQKTSSGSKPLIAADELAEAYSTLKEISASFDYDSLIFVLQSLEDYQLPDQDEEKFIELKDAAANLDWEKIKSLVD
ncbi:MAG: response regulator [Selenomonadaceae bacterium]|nr:response regulator [Selenomonadaceae bacterium]